MAYDFNLNIDGIVQGNNGTVFNFTVKDKDGARSIVGATVEVTIRRAGQVYVKQAEVTDGPNGKCKFVLSNADLTTAGQYYFQPTVFFADGTVYSDGPQKFKVAGKLAGVPTLPPSTAPLSVWSRFGVNENGKPTFDGEEIGTGGGITQPPTDGGIFFEDWVGGESVTIEPNTPTPTPDTTAPIVTVTPNGGTFASTQQVTLSSNEAATIYYTLDGATPTVVSAVYSAPLTLSATTTLKYFGKDIAGNQSVVQTVVYTKDVTVPADTTAPILTITPAATFTTTQQVTMTTNETATIYYTVDGTTPTTSSLVYSAPLNISATTTIKAFAIDTAGNSSVIQTVVYTKGAAVGYVNDASLLLKADSPTVTPYTFANKDLYFNDTDLFTYAVTFKPVADTNAALRLAYRQSPNAIKFEYTFDNKITATLTGKLANGTGSASYPNISPTTVYTVDGRYYHAVIRRTLTHLEMYMDNVLVGSVAVPSDFKIDDSTSELTIGVAGEVGQVKNVVYYNRSLTTAELTQNYEALK